jgi:hypothetical protein
MFVNNPHPGFRRSGLLGETGDDTYYQPVPWQELLPGAHQIDVGMSTNDGVPNLIWVDGNGNPLGDLTPNSAPESQVPGAHQIDTGRSTNDGALNLTWVDANGAAIHLLPPPGQLTYVGETPGNEDRLPVYAYVDESPLLPVASYAPAPTTPTAATVAPTPYPDSGSQGAIFTTVSAPAPGMSTVTVPSGAGGSQQAIPVVLLPAAPAPSPGSQSAIDNGITPGGVPPWFVDGGGDAGGVAVGSPAPAPAASAGKWILAALAAFVTMGN